MENLLNWVLLIVLALFLYSGIKITQENERFAVIVLGRFQKLIGPGLVLKLPGTGREWKRIAIGDEGEYIGDRIAKFGTVSIPIEGSSITEGHRVRISSFSNNKIWANDNGPRKEFTACHRCGYKNPVEKE
ncbi:MAG TPA: hypothetical protein VGB26_12380 [Nitrospiria bacterium]|jgi:hypothetical protein